VNSRRRATILSPVLLLFLAATGRGQTLGVDFEAGYRGLSASKSADAIFGSSGGATFGGSVQYIHARGPFLRVGLRDFGKTGEKVFVADATSEVFPLGFPLEVNITSVDIIAGWRFRLGKKQKPSPFTPYVGVGVDIASYKEESTVAGLVETDEQSKTGVQFLGGLEYRAFGSFAVSAEAGYSILSGTIGLGGISKIYGEDDIGGFRIMGRIGYRFSFK
jgi:opacity protein-like surface antigen